MPHPKVGNIAPNFILKNQDGKDINLKEFRNKKNIILYFYPRASTPGCTIQACGLRDYKKFFDKKNFITLGVSPDPIGRLGGFIAKQNLNFDLLSDEDHSIANKYGVWGPKKFMGKEFEGIIRTTFIIGIDGRLKHVLENFKTKTHHEDVQNWIIENL